MHDPPDEARAEDTQGGAATFGPGGELVAAAPAPEVLSPAARARRRRRLWWLASPLVVVTILVWVGAALAPALAVHDPVLLLLLCPAWRHLLLITLQIDAVTYFALGLARTFLPNPLYYALGREYGAAAIHWVEARSGRSGRVLRRLEKLFGRLGPIIVFFAPIGTVSALAGASGMRPRVYLPLVVVGNIAMLAGVRLVALSFSDELRVVLEFIADRVPLFTAISIALVVVVQGVQWRRGARRAAPREP